MRPNPAEKLPALSKEEEEKQALLRAKTLIMGQVEDEEAEDPPSGAKSP